MMEALLAGGLSLVGGWAGAYFHGYLNKKGENLATHEDIDKLVDQVRAVTQTTQEIEARISSDVWNQQKRWEMKREVLFEAAKIIVAIDNGLVALDALRTMEDPDGDQWIEHKHNAIMGWKDTMRRFDETQTLTTVVCTKETIVELQALGSFVSTLGSELARGETKGYRGARKELSERILRARFVIRKDLGVDGASAVAGSK